MTESTETIIGPFREVPLPEGGSAQLFMIPFDKEGALLAPRSRAALIKHIVETKPSHVFLFSHGWNNDWPNAVHMYTNFIGGFANTRARHPLGKEFRPVLIGIFWPSSVLVRHEDRAPHIAGEESNADVGPVAELMDPIAELMTLAEEVTPSHRERLYELAESRGLEAEEVSELAAMLTPVWSGQHGVAAPDDELQPNANLDPDELVAIWRRAAALEKMMPSVAFEEVTADNVPTGPFAVGPKPAIGPLEPGQPLAAGLLGKLDARMIIRTATVLVMKDRAGRVGSRGVGRLLDEVLAATNAPVHLVGHSYGCKVVMSALCKVRDGARPVASALLLQPAMSYLAFASEVPGMDAPGGYRPALERSRQPIRATFSRFDQPLTRFFHLAVRRSTDLGELRIAGTPPSRYSALGGYGPAEEDDVGWVQAQLPGSRYSGPAGARIWGVEASDVISGHGDVSNPATWWMLWDQVLAED